MGKKLTNIPCMKKRACSKQLKSTWTIVLLTVKSGWGFLPDISNAISAVSSNQTAWTTLLSKTGGAPMNPENQSKEEFLPWPNISMWCCITYHLCCYWLKHRKKYSMKQKETDPKYTVIPSAALENSSDNMGSFSCFCSILQSLWCARTPLPILQCCSSLLPWIWGFVLSGADKYPR